jgi:hypothetical protein
LCGLDSPRAWLFATARNQLIDRFRLTKEQVPLPDGLAAEPRGRRRRAGRRLRAAPAVGRIAASIPAGMALLATGIVARPPARDCGLRQARTADNAVPPAPTFCHDAVIKTA